MADDDLQQPYKHASSTVTHPAVIVMAMIVARAERR
jgi:hypothetical protein